MDATTAEALGLPRRHRERVAVLDRPRFAWAGMEIPSLSAVRNGAAVAAFDAGAYALQEAGYYHPDRWLVANWPAPLDAIDHAIATMEAQP